MVDSNKSTFNLNKREYLPPNFFSNNLFVEENSAPNDTKDSRESHHHHVGRLEEILRPMEAMTSTCCEPPPPCDGKMVHYSFAHQERFSFQFSFSNHRNNRHWKVFYTIIFAQPGSSNRICRLFRILLHRGEGFRIVFNKGFEKYPNLQVINVILKKELSKPCNSVTNSVYKPEHHLPKLIFFWLPFCKHFLRKSLRS